MCILPYKIKFTFQGNILRNREQNGYLIFQYLIFAVGFDNKQTSLRVGGGANDTTRCCWGLYSEPDFAGNFLHFRFSPHFKGLYNSAQDMGELFRDASSVQLLDENCRKPY